MGAIETWTITPTDYQKIANDAKEVLVHALVEDGALTKEDANKILKEYVILFHKKGWLGRTVAKYLKMEKEDSFYFTVAKLIVNDE
jgi:hypothetical protein